MIYLDCTHIFTWPEPHTGVQRVTRSIAREALILRKDVCLAALYTDNVFYKLTGIPQKDDTPFSYKGEAIFFYPGDIYFVLDGSWNYQIFEKLLPFKEKHNLVTGVMYHDLTPVLHANSGVSPDVFRSWLIETAQYADFFACNSNSTKSDLGKWLKKYHPNRHLCGEILFSYKFGPHIINNNKTEINLPGELQNIFNKDETYLYVSTLGYLKNHVFLLDVFDSLWRRFPYLKLCFIGREGWDRQEKLHRRMEEHPLYSRNLFWFSSFTDEEVYQAYKNSKCLLFPSFAEGFGSPIVEALHCGTPVLASDLPVFHEIAGKAIGYFDPHKPDTLISWIEKIEKKGFPHRLKHKNLTWPAWSESAAELLRKIDTAYEYIKTNGSSAEGFPQARKEPDKMNSESLSIKRLLRLNGRELIKQAYIRMLHRLPDPEGESVYLEKLLEGLPAISLLSILRLSPEGKSVNEPEKYSYLLRICGRLLGSSGIPGKIARYFYALRSLSATRGKSSAAIIGLQELERQLRERLEANELTVQEQLLALRQSITQKFDAYNNFVQSVPVTLRHLQQELSGQKTIYENETASLKQMFEQELDGIKKALVPPSSSLLPFSTYTKSPLYLEHAEKVVGENILMKGVSEREQQFYTYFSKMWSAENVEIKKKYYESYFPYLPSDKSKYPFLDIGCGTGEFLSFMQGHNIKTLGIDANESEVARCQEKGLIVHHAEAIDFLKKHEGVFSGISLLQVIEHIPQDRHIELLSIAKEKVSPNGVLIIETINPVHPLAFNGFFTDPTHIRPVSIDYLNFITQWCGFTKTGILYLSPVPVFPGSLSNPQLYYYNYAIVAYKE